MKKNSNQSIEKQVTVDGMMTFGKLDDYRHTADFHTYEDAGIEPFVGKCKVQAMRGGNVYITQYPKRLKNKPMFRQDHSSLSHGHDKYYYFWMRVHESEVEKMGQYLLRESSEAAAKLNTQLLEEKAKKGGRA